MKTKKLVALIGGTGKAGRYIRAELSKRYYAVRMLVRNPVPDDSDSETIIGDVCDFSTINDLLRNCFAVVSALGHPGGERMIFYQASSGIIRAMEIHHVRKYILLAGMNVDFPNDQKGPRTRGATEWIQTHFPASTENRQMEAELLQGSSVNWTLLRLPHIRENDEVVPMAFGLHDCLGDSINAGALATFIVDQLEQDQFVRQAPFVWNA